MSFRRYEDHTRRGRVSTEISVRFTESVAHFSKSFIDRATQILIEDETLDPGCSVTWIEIWWDDEERQIGFKPIGNKDLPDNILSIRPGLRKIIGNKNHHISMRRFITDHNIPHKKYLLKEEDMQVDTEDQMFEKIVFKLFVANVD